jgi:hypothetical protein
MRFVRRDVRDHIAYQKNGHGASCQRYRASQRRSRLKINFCEIFGVVRFSTFATLSAPFGHAVMSELSQLSGVIRKSHFRAAKTGFDPTRTSAGRA